MTLTELAAYYALEKKAANRWSEIEGASKYIAYNRKQSNLNKKKPSPKKETETFRSHLEKAIKRNQSNETR